MTVLLLESLHPDAEAVLAAHAPLLRAAEPNRPPTDTASVEAILTRGRGRITAELIERCPRLRVLARPGTGLDNVDLAAAERRGIPVIYAPGANADTVAEHTMALMLDLVRGVSRSAALVREGRWEDRGRYAGQEIRGLTLGIIGFGGVGRRTAALAGAFGMRVLVANRRTTDVPAPCSAVPLEDLLAAADIVSLHVPLTPETNRLIDARRLSLMKPGAFLVNTARGQLIDQTALTAALADGRLGGFAADVLDAEPPAPDDPLLADPRVVLTPHVASLTGATYRRMCVETARNVLAVLTGGEPSITSRYHR